MSGEAKHTPGPWEFDGPEHAIIVWSDPQHRVCFMTSDGAARANARLITAAPDLLAAAQGIRRWSIDSATPIPDEFFRPLRAAIAKAEGRA